MISNCISTALEPHEVMHFVQSLNTTTEIKNLANDLNKQERFTENRARRAAIMDITNPHTKTITLHCTDFGNISLKAPNTSPATPLLYSIPGHTILFAINQQSFTVQLYSIEQNRLIAKELVTVSEEQPLLINGEHTLFDCNPEGLGHQAFIGSITLPLRSADISVFDRESLSKIAWFPHDDSAARYLVGLELLQSMQAPDICTVAKELIHHYHPAVAWQAFQLMHQSDAQEALRYVPLLRNLENPRLNQLLDQQGTAT